MGVCIAGVAIRIQLEVELDIVQAQRPVLKARLPPRGRYLVQREDVLDHLPRR